MADKQAPLNGAYYGPAIPPPTKHYHRPGRGSGCDCFCCLFTLLAKIIVSIVFILGLAALIIWLIFRPINKVKFHVTDVSLTEFNLTANNNLNYKLAVNITIRNPNKKIGVYYDRIDARVYFDDVRLKSVPLTPFYQGHKTTSVLNPVFEGQQLLLGGAITDYNAEKNSGVYSIDVKLRLKVRFRLGKLKTPKFKPTIKCELKVPLTSSGSRLAGGFETTKCDVDF
ncbi:Late embryogenesis abundant protein [Melia azedarach]|uniref:Late embryogenesis abundant protein n=1 Tax=Melia azedarach TaxID=155640 RepID=A0ACC1X1M5_MELAZ|nr:Late embryogenesis abundant protein [Melia azedarach]